MGEFHIDIQYGYFLVLSFPHGMRQIICSFLHSCVVSLMNHHFLRSQGGAKIQACKGAFHQSNSGVKIMDLKGPEIFFRQQKNGRFFTKRAPSPGIGGHNSNL